MGGSSSRAKRNSRKNSKRRRKRQQAQCTEQQEVRPNEFSSNSYNVSEARYFGYDVHNTFTYMDNQTEFSQSEAYVDQPNRYNKCHLGEDVEQQLYVNLGKLNSFVERQSFTNDRFMERKLRRPVRRLHSFTENRLQHEIPQEAMKDFCSSRIRCNSLGDRSDRGFQFDGQSMGHKLTNFSSFNLPIQNYSFDRSSQQSSSTYDAQTSIGRKRINSHTSIGYSDDDYFGDGSTGACEEMLVFDSPVEPRVKRRRLEKSQESVDCLSDNNKSRSEIEENHSGESFSCSAISSGDNVSMATSESDESCGALNILSFPLEWSSCSVDKTGYVNISLSSPEGNSVHEYFQRSCNSNGSYLSISAIVRVENPFLHTLYLLKKEEMSIRNGHVDELYLYHGTKESCVLNICENNLDWRRYGDKHRFGKGVSFSPSATYSSHYSDDRSSNKIMILFKVLVSNSVLGSQNMNIPPNDGNISFDTSIKEDSSVIVKYNDNEFYPLYKILYTKVDMNVRR